jgi:sarcosine oxidase
MAATSPTPPRAPPPALDAVVIGVGVIGAACLDALARRGLRVLGLDRWQIPHAMGSSHGGTRVIRMAYFEGPDYVPLLQRSWRAWEALAAWRGERLLLRTGVLHFGPEDQVAAVLACARDRALPHQALSAAEIAARWPAFRPAAADAGIYEDDGGVLYAERCVSALVERAIDHGAEVRGGQRVRGVVAGADGVVVDTDAGPVRAAKVVLAAGAWSAGAEALLPLPLPLRVERQVQLWFAPTAPALVTPAAMPVFLRFSREGTFYGMPRVELPGVKVCEHFGGVATTAEALDRTPTAADESRVRAFVERHLPAAAGPLLGARVCMYTTTADEHFVIGPHPDHAERVVVATGMSGHGFKLAPAIGELVADCVADADAEIPAFLRADRFGSRAAAAARSARAAYAAAYRAAVFAEPFEPAFDDAPIVILTAYDPPGRARSDVANRAADDALHAALSAAGAPPLARVTGCSADGQHREPGYAARLDRVAALALARRFEQAAFFEVVRGELFLAWSDDASVEWLGPARPRFGAL